MSMTKFFTESLAMNTVFCRSLANPWSEQIIRGSQAAHQGVALIWKEEKILTAKCEHKV